MQPAPDEPPPPAILPETFAVRVYRYDENRAVKEPGYKPDYLGTLQVPWQTRLVMREEAAKVAVRVAYKADANINHTPDHSAVATIRIKLVR